MIISNNVTVIAVPKSCFFYWNCQD